MNTQQVIALARNYLKGLAGHEFDVLEVMKPVSPEAAVNLAKIVSKLSPLVGNLIEFNSCEYLNDQEGFAEFGKWQRQDPGFPDTIFTGSVTPTPGFEIKAWFPLATEITAQFKDSQNHFRGHRGICSKSYAKELRASSCVGKQAPDGRSSDIELLGDGGFAQTFASEVLDFLRLFGDRGRPAVGAAIFAGLSDSRLHAVA